LVLHYAKQLHKLEENMAQKPSVSKVPVTVELLHCDFCGSYHGTKEEAQRHGCYEDVPKQVYTVGDKVLVKVTVAAGMEGVGEAWVQGRITAVMSPIQAYGQSEVKAKAERLGHYNDNVIGVHATIKPHQWCYQFKLDYAAPEGDERRYYHPQEGIKSHYEFRPVA
jgi:hypothetical protein